MDVADGVAEVENNIRIVEAIEADPQFPPKLKPRVRSLFIDLVNAGIVECMAMARQEQEAHVG